MLSAKVNVDTSGFKSVLNSVQTRQVTLKGVRAGIRILQKAARGAAPKRPGSGALKAAQGVIVKKGKKGKTLSFAVQGARKRVIRYVKLRNYKKPQKVVPAFYDHLVLGGTKPHRLGTGELLARQGRYSRVNKFRQAARKGTSQTTGGHHPGSPANPYRLRAWNATKNQIGEVTLKTMGEEMQKLIRKNAIKKERLGK